MKLSELLEMRSKEVEDYEDRRLQSDAERGVNQFFRKQKRLDRQIAKKDKAKKKGK